MRVDLDHARIGCDRQAGQAAVARRIVAFEDDRDVERGGACLDAREQIDVVLEEGEGRQEDVQHAVARLDAEGGAHLVWSCLLYTSDAADE